MTRRLLPLFRSGRTLRRALACCAIAALLAPGAGAAAGAPADMPPAPLAPPAGKPHAADDGSTLVYGDGWATLVSVPDGWDSDCCDLARAHHVNLLVFPRDWDRDTPDRVMRLLVWTHPTKPLDAEWQADMRDFTARFPGVEPQPFAVSVPGQSCRGAVYRGGDAVRDYVVFCDPGADLGFRYSWSMTVYGEHTDGARYEAAFRAVVANTLPMDATIQQRAP